MLAEACEGFEKSRLRSLLDHSGRIEYPREPWRAAFPLLEMLLLVVFGTICDCDDYDRIAAWAKPIFRSCSDICPMIVAFPEGAC